MPGEPSRIKLAMNVRPCEVDALTLLRQHSAERAPGSTNWLLWSSALVAGMAASFVILQRSGWLQVAQRYWHDKA